jgi:hypothetical protein
MLRYVERTEEIVESLGLAKIEQLCRLWTFNETLLFHGSHMQLGAQP